MSASPAYIETPKSQRILLKRQGTPMLKQGGSVWRQKHLDKYFSFIWSSEQLDELMKSDNYANERKPLVLTFNLVMTIYVIAILSEDIKKLYFMTNNNQNNTESQNNTIKNATSSQTNPNQESWFNTFTVINVKSQFPFIIAIVVKVLMLVVHIGANIAFIWKQNFFTKCFKYLGFWVVLLFGISSSLQFNLDIVDLMILIAGLCLMMPLVIISINEHWPTTLGLYGLVCLYPLYIVTCFVKGASSMAQSSIWEFFFLQYAIPMAFVHYVSLVSVVVLTQRQRHHLYYERTNVDVITKEYNQILEQMPEGILIISAKGHIQFLNSELRDVLKLDEQDRGHEGQGLYMKMFKNYNLRQDLEQEDQYSKEGGSCYSSCLYTLVDDENWESEEERFYELEVCGCEMEREEDRIYTSIRKLRVEYHGQPATMLLIRNITHIINYEKSKNEGRYQELLTGTMSHEMLTPLNTIINLSHFVEIKLKRQLGNAKVQHEDMMLQINAKKYRSSAEQIPEISKNQMQVQQAFLLEERDITDSLSYIDMVRSSANILQYLVKELIDLNNIRQNRFTPNNQPQPFSSLQEACEQIINCYKVQSREKNISLGLTIKVSDSRVMRNLELSYDRQRYEQVLMNLVQNGVKFTALGGIELIIELQSIPITSFISGSGSQQHVAVPNRIVNQTFNPSKTVVDPGYKSVHSAAQILNGGGSNQASQQPCTLCGLIVTTVKDSGVGMSKEVVDKLFKLFALDSNSKKGIITTQGVGLGLSISKQLVEKLGGKIKIRTAPGQGTEVIFTIPYRCSNCAQDGAFLPLNSNFNNKASIFQSHTRQDLKSILDNNNKQYVSGIVGQSGALAELSHQKEDSSEQYMLDRNNNFQGKAQRERLKEAFGGGGLRTLLDGKVKTGGSESPTLNRNTSSNINNVVFRGIKNFAQDSDTVQQFEVLQNLGDVSSGSLMLQVEMAQPHPPIQYMQQTPLQTYNNIYDLESQRISNASDLSVQPLNTMHQVKTQDYKMMHRQYLNTQQQLQNNIQPSNIHEPLPTNAMMTQQNNINSQQDTISNRGTVLQQNIAVAPFYEFSKFKDIRNNRGGGDRAHLYHESASSPVTDMFVSNTGMPLMSLNEYEMQVCSSERTRGGGKNDRKVRGSGKVNPNNLRTIGKEICYEDLLNINRSASFEEVKVEIVGDNNSDNNDTPILGLTSQQLGLGLLLGDSDLLIGGLADGNNPSHSEYSNFSPDREEQAAGHHSLKPQKMTRNFTKVNNGRSGKSMFNSMNDDLLQGKGIIHKKLKDRHYNISALGMVQSKSEEQMIFSQQQNSKHYRTNNNGNSPVNRMRPNVFHSTHQQQLKTPNFAPVNLEDLQHFSISSQFPGIKFRQRRQIASGNQSKKQSQILQSNTSINSNPIGNNAGQLPKSVFSNNFQRTLQIIKEAEEQSLHLSHQIIVNNEPLNQRQTADDIRRDNMCECPNNQIACQNGNRPSVLIVDDNMFNLIPLELILREFCGLGCDKAMNGEEAVNMFRHDLLQQSEQEACKQCGRGICRLPSYRVILMDIQMPIMDGYEATRQILSLYAQWKCSLPPHIADQHQLSIIAVTSFTNEEAVKTCYMSGMCHVLHKPVNVNQIKQAFDRFFYTASPPQQQNQMIAANQYFPGGY